MEILLLPDIELRPAKSAFVVSARVVLRFFPLILEDCFRHILA
jgi:hypothetical protein